MITNEAFREAILKFKEEESRGSFYDIAVNLINKGFKTEAYLIILATWNFANFRYAVKIFDLISFEESLNSLANNFERLNDKEFRTADFDALHEDIETIYNTLSAINGIRYTGAPKLMHLANRKLFVMWDGYIRRLRPKRYYENLDIVKKGEWEVKKYGKRAEDYIEFLKDLQKKFKHINFEENGKTFAKAIDEFNYVNITLPIQKREKKENKEKKEKKEKNRKSEVL